MANQQKGVQQYTAYSAVVVNDHMYPRPCLYVSIGSILLHSFLLLCHPYPPSFHEMIFTLVPLIFLR